MKTFELSEFNQLLTVADAVKLKGRTIAYTHPVYRMNTQIVAQMTIGEIISEWDLAAKQKYADQKGKYKQYDTMQDYWASYFSEKRLAESKAKMVLLDESGNDNNYIFAYTDGSWFDEPTFTKSDEDRPVYYILID